MLLEMTETQKDTITVKVLNGTASGIPVYAASVIGNVSLFPASDGLSCDVVAVKPGSLTITISVDVQAGSGVKTISVTVNVVIDAAPSLEVTLGPITEQ